MISVNSTNFRFIDRGRKLTLVLVPGWATDYRIFDKLNLNFNYLLPAYLSVSDFGDSLRIVLKKYSIRRISLLGWSLGGFLAADFCQNNYSLVDKLFLVGIRKKYNFQEIDKIKEVLPGKRKGYLYKFYSDCFYKKENYDYFRKNLIKDYLNQMSLDYLVEGLNYLRKAEIKSFMLEKIKRIKIIHGEFDRIAPFRQAKEIKDKLPRADFILIKNSGHIPFFGCDFSRHVK